MGEMEFSLKRDNIRSLEVTLDEKGQEISSIFLVVHGRIHDINDDISLKVSGC